MSILIVGGDTIGSIESYLYKQGAKEVLHWNCRKRSIVHKPIPKKVECILMLTSFLAHTTMKKIKDDAKSLGIPVLYAKRNTVDVCNCLQNFPILNN